MTSEEHYIRKSPGLFAACIKSAKYRASRRTTAICATLTDDQGFVWLSYNTFVMLERLKQQALVRGDAIPFIRNGDDLVDWLNLLAERKIPFAFERTCRRHETTDYMNVTFCKQPHD